MRVVYIGLELTPDEWLAVAEVLHGTPDFSDVSTHIRARVAASAAEVTADTALKDRRERYYPECHPNCYPVAGVAVPVAGSSA